MQVLKRLVLGVILLTFPFISDGCGPGERTGTRGLNASRTDRHARQQLEVTTLTANPSDHLGSVLVAGVVGDMDAGKSVLLLVDRAEVKECGLKCEDEPGKQVPVRWTGPPPKVGSEILVSGHLRRQREGWVLTGTYAGKPTPLGTSDERHGRQESAGQR